MVIDVEPPDMDNGLPAEKEQRLPANATPDDSIEAPEKTPESPRKVDYDQESVQQYIERYYDLAGGIEMKGFLVEDYLKMYRLCGFNEEKAEARLVKRLIGRETTTNTTRLPDLNRDHALRLINRYYTVAKEVNMKNVPVEDYLHLCRLCGFNEEKMHNELYQRLTQRLEGQ